MAEFGFTKKEAKYYYDCFVFGEEPIEFLVSELAVPQLTVRNAIISHAVQKIRTRCTSWWWVWKVILLVHVLIMVGISLFLSFHEAKTGDWVMTWGFTGLLSVLGWLMTLGMVSEGRDVVKEGRQYLRDASEKDLRARLQAFERDSDPHYWLDFHKWNVNG